MPWCDNAVTDHRRIAELDPITLDTSLAGCAEASPPAPTPTDVRSPDLKEVLLSVTAIPSLGRTCEKGVEEICYSYYDDQRWPQSAVAYALLVCDETIGPIGAIAAPSAECARCGSDGDVPRGVDRGVAHRVRQFQEQPGGRNCGAERPSTKAAPSTQSAPLLTCSSGWRRKSNSLPQHTRALPS